MTYFDPKSLRIQRQVVQQFDSFRTAFQESQEACQSIVLKRCTPEHALNIVTAEQGSSMQHILQMQCGVYDSCHDVHSSHAHVCTKGRIAKSISRGSIQQRRAAPNKLQQQQRSASFPTEHTHALDIGLDHHIIAMIAKEFISRSTSYDA